MFSPLLELFRRIAGLRLVTQIIIGLCAGILLALLLPETARSLAFIGELFISALKAVAPILVFVLVIASIANHQKGQQTHIRPILLLYLIGTLSAAWVAVAASTLFPSNLQLLSVDAAEHRTSANGVLSVVASIMRNIVDNPVNALKEGNFIGILAWAVALGLVLRQSGKATRAVLTDVSQAITQIVQWVIRLAPIGVFGLVSSTLAEAGLKSLLEYLHLLAVLVGSMLFVALVINPAIVFWTTRRNPYPLVLLCLRESGITAFFTRSSAANIPVNLQLSKKLGLHQETCAVSIPLGAAINMSGAAVTITVLAMAAAHTLEIPIDLPSALLLSVVASLAACGVSGVAGGSLLLVPLACGMFGIDNDVAMKVVAIGFIISVLQDSVETALNSSTDVVFTAAVCIAKGDLETDSPLLEQSHAPR